VSTRAWGALATLYVVWGSTYLGIMVAIRTMPPFLMSSLRFLVAGAILFVISPRRSERLGWRQWAAAAVAGAALLTVGNGGITWAEQRVDSGVAALLVATMPLWLALFDRLVYGTRLPPAGVVGLVVGLGGVALLVGPGGGGTDLVGGLVCVAAAAAWAAGSLYSRRAPLPSQPLLASGMEMLAGGALLAVAGLVAGEAGRVHPAQVSAASALALAYLVVVGSIVAFSAFHWLLRNAPTSTVSTYAYVNPVVAVLLGAAFLGEPMTLRTLIAGLAIVVSVVLIVGGRRVRLPRLETSPVVAAFRRAA
jgi:drug/metabolite transporter (DMT)-like permease